MEQVLLGQPNRRYAAEDVLFVLPVLDHNSDQELRCSNPMWELRSKLFLQICQGIWSAKSRSRHSYVENYIDTLQTNDMVERMNRTNKLPNQTCLLESLTATVPSAMLKTTGSIVFRRELIFMGPKIRLHTRGSTGRK